MATLLLPDVNEAVAIWKITHGVCVNYTQLENTSIDPNDKLEFQKLLDLLIVYIKEYDKLLATKVYTVEEFTQCKRILAQLHSQIKEKGERLGYKMTSVLPSFPENMPAEKTST